MKSSAKKQKQNQKTSTTIRYLKYITPNEKYGSSIKVKAIRVWKTNYLDPKVEQNSNDSIIIGEPLLNYNINMILMDEQGTKIHACANFYTIYKPSWEKPLKEGAYLLITDFKCVANKAPIRLTEHPSKIYFNKKTTITVMDEFKCEADDFTFVVYETVINKKINMQLAFDIIGEIVSNNKVRQVSLHEKPTSLLEYELRNTSGEKIRCVLWGDDADTLQDYINHHIPINKPVVIIIQLAKVTVWEGNYQVSNINKASKIYINNHCNHHINLFKERLAANLANGTCKEAQVKLTTTINSETRTNNSEMGTKRDWEKLNTNTNHSVKRINNSDDNKERKRLRNIKNIICHDVIDIEVYEKQQNLEAAKKTRNTIEISDDDEEQAA